MLCQNCGRQVEFVGNVCAWCGAPKMQSQSIHLYSQIFGIALGFLGVFIGNKVDPEIGWLVGGLIGVVVGALLGIKAGSNVGTVNVQCPNCGTALVVNRAQGPNYNCPQCGGLFHLK